MSYRPILPISGVPDELVRVLNDRFRNITLSAAPEAAAPAAPEPPAKPKVDFHAPEPKVLHGTHAARAGYPARDGDLYIETDNYDLAYLYIGATTSWMYVSGTCQSTQGSLAALAGTLTAADTGLLVEVTDYAHVLRWTGSGWQWGPGETGGGMLVSFAVAPGTGWVACSGGSASYLKSDGTTGTVTLPNASAAYLKSGGYDPTVTVKALPTFTGTAAQVTSAPSATVTIQSGSGATPASGTHTHTLTPAGTIALPGDPIPNFSAPLYFRQ